MVTTEDSDREESTALLSLPGRPHFLKARLNGCRTPFGKKHALTACLSEILTLFALVWSSTARLSPSILSSHNFIFPCPKGEKKNEIGTESVCYGWLTSFSHFQNLAGSWLSCGVMCRIGQVDIVMPLSSSFLCCPNSKLRQLKNSSLICVLREMIK